MDLGRLDTVSQSFKQVSEIPHPLTFISPPHTH